jgi:hypothetical protein
MQGQNTNKFFKKKNNNQFSAGTSSRFWPLLLGHGTSDQLVDLARGVTCDQLDDAILKVANFVVTWDWPKIQPKISAKSSNEASCERNWFTSTKNFFGGLLATFLHCAVAKSAVTWDNQLNCGQAAQAKRPVTCDGQINQNTTV